MLKRWLFYCFFSLLVAPELIAQTDTLPLTPKIPNWQYVAIDRKDSIQLHISIYANGALVPNDTKNFKIKKQAEIEFVTKGEDSAFASFINAMSMDIGKNKLLSYIAKQPEGKPLIIKLILAPQEPVIDSAAIVTAYTAGKKTSGTDTLIVYTIAGILITGLGFLIYNSINNNKSLKLLKANKNAYTIPDGWLASLHNDDKNPKYTEHVIFHLLEQYKHNQAKQNEGIDALKAELEKVQQERIDKENELSVAQEKIKTNEASIQELNTKLESFKNDETLNQHRKIALRIDEELYGPMMDKIDKHKIADEEEAKRIVLSGLLKIALHSISLNRLIVRKDMNTDKMNTDLLFKKQVTPDGTIDGQSQPIQTDALPYYVMKLLQEHKIKTLDGVLFNGFKING